MTDSGEQVDGRSQRAEATRELVIDAYTALLMEGNLRPTFDEVAARAQVSRRSVFNNFKDNEGLVAAVGARSMALATADFERISPELPLDERINRFVRRRAKVLERIAPLSRSLQINVPFSEPLKKSRARHFARVRQELEHLFPDELGEGKERELRIGGLLSATSAVSWATLRDDLGFGLERSVTIMQASVSGLLRP